MPLVLHVDCSLSVAFLLCLVLMAGGGVVIHREEGLRVMLLKETYGFPPPPRSLGEDGVEWGPGLSGMRGRWGKTQKNTG